MNKKMSMALMGLGTFLMIVLFFSYSFGVMGNAKMTCTVLWFVCIGIVRIAAASWSELER